MQLSKCCNEPVIGKAVGEDDSIYYCSLCEHYCESNTYDDESPHEIAKQFNLEYIGCNQVDIVNYGQVYKKMKKLYYFNDSETLSTLAVYDLSELESKITESRKRFNK